MKSKLVLSSVALFAFIATVVVYAAPSTKAPNSRVTGDYVEARTASVFCGACHYNAELMTLGQNALMAWNFTGGTYDGVDLSGVRAVAAVSSESNLSLEGQHKTELIIDSAASDQQAKAVADLLKTKCGDQLGQIVVVRRAPVTFAHQSARYEVDVKGTAAMAVQYLPDDSCCVMASDVWYTPLSPIEHRKVGFTEYASFAGEVGSQWQRSGENSAFYGTFSF